MITCKKSENLTACNQNKITWLQDNYVNELLDWYEAYLLVILMSKAWAHSDGTRPPSAFTFISQFPKVSSLLLVGILSSSDFKNPVKIMMNMHTQILCLAVL